MAGLNYLRRAGLTVDLVSDRLCVSPVERLTEPLRQYIRAHRPTLLVEVLAEREATLAQPESAPAAPSEPKRTAWSITRAGRPVGYMVGQLMTYSEALACAVMRWPDAEILETR